MSLILRYALAMGDAEPLLARMDVVRERWAELTLQQQSLFGWEHLLLDIPAAELPNWMHIKAVVPADLGGRAFQHPISNEQKKVGSSVIWDIERQEMRFDILLLLGRTTEDIASELNCSKSRLYNIRAKLRAKLDIGNTTSLSKTLRDRWVLGRMLLEVADE